MHASVGGIPQRGSVAQIRGLLDDEAAMEQLARVVFDIRDAEREHATRVMKSLAGESASTSCSRAPVPEYQV